MVVFSCGIHFPKGFLIFDPAEKEYLVWGPSVGPLRGGVGFIYFVFFLFKIINKPPLV